MRDRVVLKLVLLVGAIMLLLTVGQFILVLTGALESDEASLRPVIDLTAMIAGGIVGYVARGSNGGPHDDGGDHGPAD